MRNTIVFNMENCLNEQSNLVDKIYSLQRSMYSSVLERDWLVTEKLLRTLDDLSKKFLKVDKDLYNLIYDNCLNKENPDFFESTKEFETGDQKKLNNLYKKLKKQLYDSKIENEAFSKYISHAQSLFQGIVNIISEDRAGKCYTHKGERVSADMSSLVFNRSL